MSFLPRLLLLAVLLCGRSVAAEAVPPHEALHLASVAMGEKRLINVYLPPGYDVDQTVRYPILYVLDGGVREDFPHVAAMADRLIRAGVVRPFLVAGIENTVRRRDMTGPTRSAHDLEVTSQPGGAPRFRRFIRAELMPALRARYRASGESAVIGESLAGLFVVETLMLGPRLFDTHIAIDPSLWWNEKGLIREAPERLAEWGDRRARLLLTAGGTASNSPEVDAFAALLRRAAPPGLQWEYLPRPDLRHDNIYRAMEEALLRSAFAATDADRAQ
ncbi:MAG: alpha/beta hydrolase [Rhodanobacteraceae bacterium]|jgi:hypothetical protein|nr:alpha/beta hydrolase [Rhodanobacteraceae bacterium]